MDLALFLPQSTWSLRDPRPSLEAHVRGKDSIDPVGPWGVFFGMDYRERITIEPGKRGGKPCIRGLRITVYEILDYLAAGMTPDLILADFPDLEAEDIQATLAFAADRERKLFTLPLP